MGILKKVVVFAWKNRDFLVKTGKSVVELIKSATKRRRNDRQEDKK